MASQTINAVKIVGKCVNKTINAHNTAIKYQQIKTVKNNRLFLASQLSFLFFGRRVQNCLRGLFDERRDNVFAVGFRFGFVLSGQNHRAAG